MSDKRLKIIHIMNHPPAYEEYSDKPRPEINWDSSDGSWVGIWGYDWADQLASEILKITDEFEHEVWQPDLRADKIYSHTFENRLIHRMFPAYKKKNGEMISPLMLNFISGKYLTDNYIFHIGYPHFSGLNRELIEAYKNKKFILTFHGEIKLPVNGLFRIQKNPFKKLVYLKQHFLAKRYFKFIEHITYMNDKNLNMLKRYYNGNLTKITMGIDTHKFRAIDKIECRKKLFIPEGTKVLLTISRLYELKQIDKFINVLDQIHENFLFIIIGHGTREYEKYLRIKAKNLLKKDKIRFEGYKRDNELVTYYSAADLFIHVSKSEAGPVVNMEAMACGLPILTTNTGNTAEFLKENNAGKLVGIKDYKQWKTEIENFLSGQVIQPIDISLARTKYDWENVAKKFNIIYKTTT